MSLVHLRMGEFLLEKGDVPGALQEFSLCVAENPANIPALANLALCQSILGKKQEAEASLGKAYVLASDNPDLAYNYALLLGENRKIFPALEILQKLSPSPEIYLLQGNLYGFVGDILNAHISYAQAFDLSLSPDAAQSWVNSFWGLKAGRLEEKVRERCLKILDMPEIDPAPMARAILEILPDGALAARDPLLLKILKRALVLNPRWELLLTKLRKDVALGQETLPEEWLVALAYQANRGEYAWGISKEEENIPQEFLYLYQAKPEKFTEEILQLTPISDQTSRDVQNQYEENPYPRWDNFPFIKPKSLQELVGNPDIPYIWPSRPQVLVAGCGTGQHAIKCAKRIKNADVLAIDLSQASLKYGQRKAREMGIENLKFAQADILELQAGPFDLIESVGVIHHMKEPDKGIARLVSLLHPQGILKLGLYSRIGRKDIIKAREEAIRQGYSYNNIREFRQMVLHSLPESPFYPLIDIPDFYSMSELRDLLFHVQEHNFSIPEIEEIITRHGLVFLGFDMDKQKFENVFPGQTQNLELWKQFEERNPEFFMAMYNFWLFKNKN